LLIAGIVVAALGAFVLVRGINYPSNHNMMRIGGFQASVQHDRAVPQWAGIAAVLGGALMIGVGLRGRKG
jgi:drug/metabolite transporter (DMT)-like permease